MNKLEIYGTLGPSCCQREIIKKMLDAGMTGMRLNLSHCNLWERKDWIDEFHAACQLAGVKADLMIDMRGPEIRVNDLAVPLSLEENTVVELTDEVLPAILFSNAVQNDILLLDDGKIKLNILEVQPTRLKAHVIHGGLLKKRKSAALQGKSIQGPTLTESDIQNIQEANRFGVTSIMQPFVKSKKDLMDVKESLHLYNADNLRVFAKIENLEGVAHLEELLEDSDQIVIARGDLGNASGLIHLPTIQKQIENYCKKLNKPYMVVTEMLHSMQENPTPTRAEVSDVFHAVYHGASSIMLTGETASGKYPLEAMIYFVNVAKEALKERMKENDLLD